jgi:hypothetical protein
MLPEFEESERARVRNGVLKCRAKKKEEGQEEGATGWGLLKKVALGNGKHTRHERGR